ncbi:MAG: glycosyltransferase [Clostridia bacterium]|nr:glycosyltransferase [Clostridia bacterium]
MSGYLESLVHQTYEALEIILVNDGSTDKSAALCDAWSQKDSRIHVLHQQNGGLSNARNAGLQLASSKFVAFADIDDFVHPQMYEVLHALAEKYALDMAACAFDCVTERSVAFEQYDPAALVETAEIFSGEQALSSFFEYYRALLRAPVWCKLYKTQLVKKIGFVEGRIHEDEFFFHRIVGSCKGIGKTSAVLYYYYQSPDSIVRSTYNLKRFDIVYAMRDRFFYFKASGIEGQTNAWGAYYIKKNAERLAFCKKRASGTCRLLPSALFKAIG